MFLTLGINIEGQKELLDMWPVENEGPKFWLNVLTELKNRSMKDILIVWDSRYPQPELAGELD